MPLMKENVHHEKYEMLVCNHFLTKTLNPKPPGTSEKAMYLIHSQAASSCFIGSDADFGRGSVQSLCLAGGAWDAV